MTVPTSDVQQRRNGAEGDDGEATTIERHLQQVDKTGWFYPNLLMFLYHAMLAILNHNAKRHSTVLFEYVSQAPHRN